MIRSMGGKNQDFREAVDWVKGVGWRVDEERRGYPMAFCPCGRHTRTIHRTPSNPNYFNEMRRWVLRTCTETTKGGSS